MSCRSVPSDRPPPSPVPDATRRGWHKTSTSFLKSALTGHDSLSLGGDSTVSGGRGTSDCSSGGTLTRISDPESDSHIEGILSTEASMVVLDTLELIVQVCSNLSRLKAAVVSMMQQIAGRLLHGPLHGAPGERPARPPARAGHPPVDLVPLPPLRRPEVVRLQISRAPLRRGLRALRRLVPPAPQALLLLHLGRALAGIGLPLPPHEAKL